MPHESENSDIIIYQSEDGKIRLDVRSTEETVWLTTEQMALLFGRDRSVIARHIKNVYEEGELPVSATCAKFAQVQNEGERQVTRHPDFYNLDVIISVGYRVKSLQGTRFRIWATKILLGYIQKGFAIDKERMKSGNSMNYFDELQEQIREIRLSERVFYQKIKDIYKLSIDYNPQAEQTVDFFKTVQNKLLWAISQKTAAELVVTRANGQLPFMGMTSYDKTLPQRITKTDAMTAKNYLTEAEVKDLSLLVEQYLAFAEAQARRQVPMYMKDWIERLDAILHLNGRELLTHAGKISHDMAKQTAEVQLEVFRKYLTEQQRAESIKELEADIKQAENLPKERGES